jgi:hypothetical protein
VLVDESMNLDDGNAERKAPSCRTKTPSGGRERTRDGRRRGIEALDRDREPAPSHDSDREEFRRSNADCCARGGT